MDSANSRQQNQPLQHHHLPCSSPLPDQLPTYGASTAHEWSPNIPSFPWNGSNYDERLTGVSFLTSFAHQSQLSMAEMREEAHLPSPITYFGGANQNPSSYVESSWLINGRNSGLIQLPFSSSSASSSPSAAEYFFSSDKINGHWSPYDRNLGEEECVSWGVGEVKQRSATPLNSSSKASAFLNGVTGTKRRRQWSEPSKAAHAGAKKSPLKTSCAPFKVRKEKLGDRIAALHQLVSPFGKTDTASVLTEAIGYIQFLQDQIHVSVIRPHLLSIIEHRSWFK
ncbi:hypothetical protein Nepgr_027020 [Nepenthes gracilis]|uniref:BHLH domain-containing protein n=1 Tax=Nepenthes gracilis TaxID=150966 RepID=A0AAD3T990_NEPGR|nr:hypothetical protein Nepgr_027020 [Nepenthes gracilis]